MEVRTASVADMDVLSRVLARAFHHDPFHRWIFATEAACKRNSHRSFVVAMRGQLPYGTVFTTDRLEGAALWAAPERVEPGFLETLRLGVRTLPIFGARAPLVLRGFLRLQTKHPKRPHWYLQVLGTDPEHQRRGVGSALLAPVLARCDAEGLPAYLKASRKENLPFYRRHGFELVEEFELPKGPIVWLMLREPTRRNQSDRQLSS